MKIDVMFCEIRSSFALILFEEHGHNLVRDPRNRMYIMYISRRNVNLPAQRIIRWHEWVFTMSQTSRPN